MGMTVLRKGGSTPVASDDRILFDKIFDAAGIIVGGGATMSAVNKIHVPETTAWIKGTEIKIDDQDVTVGLSDSDTKYGRVILVLDWSTEEVAHFEYEIAASASAFRELIQDEDINFSAGIWEEVFATYTCTEASISNVAFCMSTLQDASGGSLIAGSESGTLSTQPYVAGQYLIWNGKLKKATAPIAIGDVLAVGTNLSADTTVGNELYALNSSLDNIDIRYTTANGAEWSPRGAGTWHPFSGTDAVFVNATRSYVINKDGSNYSTNTVGNNDAGAQTIINNLKKSDFISDATKYVGASGYYYTNITLNKAGIYICGSYDAGTDFFLKHKNSGSIVTFDSITYGNSLSYLVYVGA